MNPTLQETTLRVLLIEDDEADLFLVQEILSRHAERSSLGGFDICHATTLNEGLALLEAGRFDVVLLDLTLPDSRGLESLATVRSRRPDVPVVILSNANDERLSIEAVRAGAQDFLVKGQVEAMRLSRIMHYAVARKQNEAASLKSGSPAGTMPPNLFRVLVDHMSMPLLVIGRDARLLYANPIADARFSLPARPAPFEAWAPRVTGGGPEDAQRLSTAIQRALREWKSISVDIAAPSGATTHLEATPLPEEGGNGWGAMLRVCDPSEGSIVGR